MRLARSLGKTLASLSLLLTGCATSYWTSTGSNTQPIPADYQISMEIPKAWFLVGKRTNLGRPYRAKIFYASPEDFYTNTTLPSILEIALVVTNTTRSSTNLTVDTWTLANDFALIETVSSNDQFAATNHISKLAEPSTFVLASGQKAQRNEWIFNPPDESAIRFIEIRGTKPMTLAMLIFECPVKDFSTYSNIFERQIRTIRLWETE